MNIIWIHGFGEDSIIWEDFIQKIDSDHQHFLFDYSAQTGFYSIKEYADLLNDFILSNEINRPVLIGHSMGGYIAVEFAANYSDKISGLGLFHSSALADSQDKKEQRLKTIDFISRNGASVFIKNYYQNLFSEENRSIFKDIIDRNTSQFLSFSTEALVSGTRSMMNRNENLKTLEDLSFPVFQILGKKDQFVLLGDALKQTLLLQNPYTLVLGDSAHAGMYESPGICAAFINNYLRKL